MKQEKQRNKKVTKGKIYRSTMEVDLYSGGML